jgi:hypothetical protein
VDSAVFDKYILISKFNIYMDSVGVPIASRIVFPYPIKPVKSMKNKELLPPPLIIPPKVSKRKGSKKSSRGGRKSTYRKRNSAKRRQTRMRK